MGKILFDGWVDAGTDGLLPCEIYQDGDFYYAYVGGELADHISSADEFAGNYGPLYKNKDDFKKGEDFCEIYDFWPDENSL